MSNKTIDLKDLDKTISRILMIDATLTNEQIGEKIGLSQSATNERIRKLKKEGIIKKTIALIDRNFLDLNLGAFIFLVVEGRENNILFLKQILSHPNIIECHHITGDYSYVLKIFCKDTQALENLITDFIKEQKGVTKTMTQIILSSSKE